MEAVDVRIEADLHEAVVALDLRRQLQAAFDLGEVGFELTKHGGRLDFLRAEEKAEALAAFSTAEPDGEGNGEREGDENGAKPEEEAPRDHPGDNAPGDAEKGDAAKGEDDLPPVHAIEFALLGHPFDALAGDDFEDEGGVKPHHHRGHEGEDDGIEQAAEEGQHAEFQGLEDAAADHLIEQDDELRHEDERGGEA